MTWKSHRMTTFATVYFLTGNPIPAAIALTGSTLPDQIEGPLRYLFHRTISHWFLPYLILSVILYRISDININYMEYKNYPTETLVTTALFWFITGALLHIPEDAICGTIPLLNPAKKTKVFPTLFKVGSIQEYLFTIPYTAILIAITLFIKIKK